MEMMESVPECLLGVQQYSISQGSPNPTLVGTVLAQTWPFMPAGQLCQKMLYGMRDAALPPLTFTAIPAMGPAAPPICLPYR
jgi:hypothetical protein